MSTKAILNIYQGTVYNLQIKVSGSNSQPFDLTGYSAKGDIRQIVSGDVLTSFAISGSFDSAGTFYAQLDKVASAKLIPPKCVYDIMVYQTAGNAEYCICYGDINVISEITRR